MTTTKALAIPDRPDLVVARTDSWMAVVEDVAVLAQRIAGTELVPAALRGKAPAVAASILYGREIGLPPMTALRSVYVVNGQVALKAEAMRGLILAAGHELVFTEATSARCVVHGRRKGQEDWQDVTWTIDDARKANLTRNNTWTNYPRAMLKARATAELARDLFADVISGFVALEEVDGADPDVQHDGTEPPPPKRTARRRTTGGELSHPIPGDRELPLDETPASAVDDGPSAAEAGTVPLPGEPGYGDDAVSPIAPTSADETPSPAPTSDEDSPGRDTSTYRTYPAQRTKMHAVLTELGVKDRAVRLRLASLVIGRSIDTSDDLTRGEASLLIDTLTKVAASQTLRTELAQVLTADDPVAELDAIAVRIGALAATHDAADEPTEDDVWRGTADEPPPVEDPWPTTT